MRGHRCHKNVAIGVIGHDEPLHFASSLCRWLDLSLWVGIVEEPDEQLGPLVVERGSPGISVMGETGSYGTSR